MYRLLTLLLLAFALHVSASDNFDALVSQFDDWAHKHNKVYPTQAERLYRLAVYSANAQRVQQLNAQSNGGAEFSLNNRFADLTAKEFKSIYLGYKPTTDAVRPARELLQLNATAVPAIFNWIEKKKVTAVKDQGQCGSCWAFSATENIESVWMIAKDLTPEKFRPLAPQQIVDCDTVDAGCNGGDTITAFQYVIKTRGQDTEASYPYKAVNEACHFKEADVEARIVSYKYATTTLNEEQMKTATATVAPLSICVDAEPWQFYTKGVMTKAQCGTSLDHCVQITGYDTAAKPPFWEVRNSWGEAWGEKGFIRLEFGTNTCGVAEEATTAVV